MAINSAVLARDRRNLRMPQIIPGDQPAGAIAMTAIIPGLFQKIYTLIVIGAMATAI